MFDISLVHFTPGQAHAITGVAVDQQRNLRRHGYLALEQGHARFSVHDLARLAAIKALSDRGIGPSLTARLEEGFDIATLCGSGILWHLLLRPEAYSGDHWNFSLGGPPRLQDPEADDLADRAAVELARQGHDPSSFLLLMRTDWGSRSDILRKGVFHELGLPRAVPSRFFIWWADGSHVWHPDLAKAFSDSRYCRQGAVVVVDQMAMAENLLTKIAGPVARITVREE